MYMCIMRYALKLLQAIKEKSSATFLALLLMLAIC